MLYRETVFTIKQVRYTGGIRQRQKVGTQVLSLQRQTNPTGSRQRRGQGKHRLKSKPGITSRHLEQKAGTFLHGDKMTNWQQRGNTGSIYIYTLTNKHQVKVIRAGTDNQEGGGNPTHGGRSGTRGEVKHKENTGTKL